MVDKVLRAANIATASIHFTSVVRADTHKVNRTMINACSTWLWKELAVIQPKLVVAMGTTASKLLLNGNSKFRLADVVFHTKKVDTMVAEVLSLYSPSYLLNHGIADIKRTVNVLKGVAREFT